MFFCSKKKGNTLVEASVANGAIVVTYKGKDAPRVWRRALAFASTATLELQEADGMTRLVMKVAGGPTEEILSLKDKDAVRAAFDALADVLAQDHTPAIKKGGFFRKLFKFVLWVCIIGFLLFLSLPIFFKAALLPSGPLSPRAQLEQPAQNPVAAKPTTPKQGVPLPASDIFGE